MASDIDTPISCSKCSKRYTVRELLRSGLHFWADVNALIAKAPCCGDTVELRVETGKVWIGYTYAAGSAHFAPMEEYEAPGLVAVTSNDSVKITAGDEILVYSK